MSDGRHAAAGVLTMGEEGLTGIVDALASGVCVVDPQGLVVLFNAAAESISGRRSDDVVGRPFREVFEAWSPERGEPALGRTLHSGEGVAGATERVRTADGRDVTLSVRTSPLRRDGELIGAVAVFSEVDGPGSDLETDFVSLIAHELRTPLAAVKGYVDILLEGEAGELGDLQREFLSVVSRNNARALQIIGRLLDICRIESGRVRMDRRRTYLGDVLEVALAELRCRMSGRSVELVEEIPEHLPFVYVDPTRIEEAIVELLSNALHFTPDGGRIVLRVEEDAGRVRIRVEDTGAGIAEEDAPRVFEKFFRAGEPIGGERGSGLGLSLVRAIVSAHGGLVSVHPREGGGTVAQLALPLGEEGEPSLVSHLRDSLLENKRAGRPVGLVLVRVANIADLRASLGEEAAMGLLWTLQEALAKTVRGADIVSGMGEGVLAALPSATGRGLEAVASRIRDRLSHWRPGAGGADVPLEIGWAACPDDAEDADGLLRHAEEHMQPL